MDAQASPVPQPLATPPGPEIEYATLRDESLRRLDQRQQVLSVTMTLAAAFLGIGWGSGSVAMLIYPLLALLLAVGWAQNEIRMRRLNAYIRDHLEPLLPGIGYERFIRQRETASRLGAWPLDIFAIGGIFLLTQLLAIGLALFKFSGQMVEWLLIFLSLGAVGILLVVVEQVRRESVQ